MNNAGKSVIKAEQQMVREAHLAGGGAVGVWAAGVRELPWGQGWDSPLRWSGLVKSFAGIQKSMCRLLKQDCILCVEQLNGRSLEAAAEGPG